MHVETKKKILPKVRSQSLFHINVCCVCLYVCMNECMCAFKKYCIKYYLFFIMKGLGYVEC